MSEPEPTPEAATSRVRVHNFSISLDGFGVGEGQTLTSPFGHAGGRLLSWAVTTRTFELMGLHGDEPGSTGVDDAFASRWADGIGAEIMGRHKFAPADQPWPDPEWEGWWGEDPPFHTPGGGAHSSPAAADPQGGRHIVLLPGRLTGRSPGPGPHAGRRRRRAHRRGHLDDP